MNAEKNWVLPDKISIPQAFQAAIGGHPLVAQTLYQLGFKTYESARAFLDPAYYQPAPPGDLPDMAIACDLLSQAIREQKRILVWGDFDVDGQTATTVLVEGLRQLGARVSYHIPVRARESHGINTQVLKTKLASGFDLLLTCDTGISEHASLQIVHNLGIPVIVTDHHTLGENLPPASAVINPQRLEQNHPLRTLPGVGVAYKLIEGLFARQGDTTDLGHLLELVALGIVADVAELAGDTRYLLQKGLVNLRLTQRIGLSILYQNAELNPANLNEGHIGFQIAPRLNAVGRLGDANPMVEFLTTEDTGKARALANLIEGMNIKRRTDTRQVEQGAEMQLAASSADRHAPAILLHHPTWPGGVVGIVASRLVERYRKPTLLLTGEDPIHGSARSVPGVHITEVIAAQADLLNGYGGHPMAAGLSMPAQNLTAFKRRFNANIETRLRDVGIVDEVQVAQELTIKELSLDLVKEIDRLAPFGPGNPPLQFLLRDLTLISESTVGSDQEHRQVIVADSSGNELRMIWWNGADEPLPEAQFDLVCKLSESDFRGASQLSAEWVDFRLSEAGEQELKARHVDIIDVRAAVNPQAQLEACLAEEPQSNVWGEGDLPGDHPFRGRHELHKNLHLIIWTTPPSQSVLQRVIRLTKPHKVTVFAFDPNLDDQTRFMTRLAGAARYAIAHLDGIVSLDRLTAACAADEAAVKAGLLLWQAKGKLRVDFEQDMVGISMDAPAPDPLVTEKYAAILDALLEESRSFRRYFRSGDLQGLITR
jgi:single-stranded-DNA-specific exonuclease